MQEKLKVIASTLVSASSVFINVLGLSSLSWKIHKRKSLGNVSQTFIYSMSFSTIALFFYGLVYKDPFVYIPEGIGTVFCIILIMQLFIYKKNEPPDL